jgi:polyisoprenoid-binding protein YceI
MSSIAVTDEMPDEDKKKLEGHLGSEDFFQTKEFPTATFIVTSVETYNADKNVSELKHELVNEFKLPDNTHLITGNLTIRGVEKSITFPAKLEVSETGVHVNAKFSFDRTAFGVHYGSEGSLGDKMILHEIFLHIQLNTQSPS